MSIPLLHRYVLAVACYTTVSLREVPEVVRLVRCILSAVRAVDKLAKVALVDDAHFLLWGSWLVS